MMGHERPHLHAVAACCLVCARIVAFSIHDELVCVLSQGRVVYLIHLVQIADTQSGWVIPTTDKQGPLPAVSTDVISDNWLQGTTIVRYGQCWIYQ
jgi:hypothetical protein